MNTTDGKPSSNTDDLHNMLWKLGIVEDASSFKPIPEQMIVELCRIAARAIERAISNEQSDVAADGNSLAA